MHNYNKRPSIYINTPSLLGSKGSEATKWQAALTPASAETHAPAGFNLLIHILEAVSKPMRPERMRVILLFRPRISLATVHDDVRGMTIHLREGMAFSRSLAVDGRVTFMRRASWAS